MGVGLEPSSELRVKKKRKETTIIEVNAIYSPELLTGWGLYKVKEKRKREEEEARREAEPERDTIKQIRVCAHPGDSQGVETHSNGGPCLIKLRIL